MQISLNGQAEQVTDGTTLTELVQRITDRNSGIAVAIDGEVVPRTVWPSTVLLDGYRVDVVTAVQGG
ncbi:MAG: sulfur carrier protein ThiS [Jatrophihabitantaceae bacterium]